MIGTLVFDTETYSASQRLLSLATLAVRVRTLLFRVYLARCPLRYIVELPSTDIVSSLYTEASSLPRIE
jgi:hypothetical protein